MKAFKKEIKVTLHVFIGEILANMTQVSDVAPGPLVKLTVIHVYVPLQTLHFLNQEIKSPFFSLKITKK
jgi:hypothetical protein